MNYYKLCFFEPYDHSDYIIIAHDKLYTNFELSTIIQEVVDGVVEDYAAQDTYRHIYPCDLVLDISYDNIGGFPKGALGNVLSRLKEDYDFEIIIPIESIDIQKTHLFNQEFNDDNPKYLYERYVDFILGECNECHRENWRSFDGCPVKNERRRKI